MESFDSIEAVDKYLSDQDIPNLIDIRVHQIEKYQKTRCFANINVDGAYHEFCLIGKTEHGSHVNYTYLSGVTLTELFYRMKDVLIADIKTNMKTTKMFKLY